MSATKNAPRVVWSIDQRDATVQEFPNFGQAFNWCRAQHDQWEQFFLITESEARRDTIVENTKRRLAENAERNTAAKTD